MADRPENVAADEALGRLVAGNERYSCDKLDRPACDAARREELVGGQRPFATILTCADSRVAPEHVFDYLSGLPNSFQNDETYREIGSGVARTDQRKAIALLDSVPEEHHDAYLGGALGDMVYH